MTNEEKIEEQEFYFKAYSFLPIIIAGIIFISILLVGVGNSIAIRYLDGYGNTLYRFMKLPSLWTSIMIWVAIALLFSIMAYLIAKVQYSYKILVVCYLRKLIKEDGVNNGDEEKKEEGIKA